MWLNKYIFLLFFSFILLAPVTLLGISLPWPKVALIFIVFYTLFKSKKMYTLIFSKFIFLIVFLNLVIYIFHLLNIDYSPNLRDFNVILSPVEIILVISSVPLFFFKEQNLESNFKSLSILFFIISLIGVLEFVNVLNFKASLMKIYGERNEMWEQYFMYNIRSASVFNNSPNTFGLFSVYSFIVMLISKRFVYYNLYWYYSVIFLIILGTLLSGSITALAIMILVSLIIILNKGNIFKNILILTITSLILFFSFQSSIDNIVKRQKLDESIIPSSLKARMNNVWAHSFEMIENSLIIGIGPSINSLKFGVDNEYLDKYLRFGLIGGTFFIFFIFFTVIIAHRKFKLSVGIMKNLYLISFLFSITFSLSLITGSFFRSEKLTYLFWIIYCLPFYLDFKSKELYE